MQAPCVFCTCDLFNHLCLRSMKVVCLCRCKLLIMHMDLEGGGEGMQAGACMCDGCHLLMQVPCAAMGLLRTMEATLLERRVWSGALDMLPAPAFLSLMLLLVPLHPLLHTKVTFTRLLKLAFPPSSSHSPPPPSPQFYIGLGQRKLRFTMSLSSIMLNSMVSSFSQACMPAHICTGPAGIAHCCGKCASILLRCVAGHADQHA